MGQTWSMYYEKCGTKDVHENIDIVELDVEQMIEDAIIKVEVEQDIEDEHIVIVLDNTISESQKKNIKE